MSVAGPPASPKALPAQKLTTTTVAKKRVVRSLKGDTRREWIYWAVASIIAAALPFLPRGLDPGPWVIGTHQLPYLDRLTQNGELFWSAAIIFATVLVQLREDPCPPRPASFLTVASILGFAIALTLALQLDKLVALDPTKPTTDWIGPIFAASLSVYLISLAVSAIRLVLMLGIPIKKGCE